MMELMPKFIDNPSLTVSWALCARLTGIAIVLARNASVGTLGTVPFVIGWIDRALAQPRGLFVRPHKIVRINDQRLRIGCRSERIAYLLRNGILRR